MRQACGRLRGLFLAAAAAGALSTQTVAKSGDLPVVLSDFEESSPGWTYYGGYEFKGAKGRCVIDSEEKKSGEASLRLDADFTEGGSYVAATKKHQAPASKLRFWVKAPGVHALDVRVKDASDQVFQHRIPLEASGDWQQVTLENFSDAKGFWGGPKDGVWHGPLHEIMIMLSRNALDSGKEASIWIDDVTFEEEPPAKPAAM